MQHVSIQKDNLYANQGKLDEAETMYQRALQGKEKAWGPDHASTLDTVNNLGNIYAMQGKLGEAEKMYQEALQGMEKACGPDHISALQMVNNLGNLYANLGNWTRPRRCTSEHCKKRGRHRA